MCGRYSLALTFEQIQAHFDQVEITHAWRKSFNIAPTHSAFIITNTSPNLIQEFEWGLVPYWSKTGQNHGKLINARMETISTKPSFKIPFREKRCLVLADSYYEWKLYGKQKIPYRILSKREGLLVFAGIWDIWTQGNKTVKSFSIITTPANEDVAHIHTRMPVILDTKEKQSQWLSHQDKQLLEPLKPNWLKNYLVTTKLNKTNFKGAEAHVPLPEIRDLFSDL